MHSIVSIVSISSSNLIKFFVMQFKITGHNIFYSQYFKFYKLLTVRYY